MLVLSDEICTRLVLDEVTVYSDCGVSGGLEVEVIDSAMVLPASYCTVEEVNPINPMVIVGGGAGVIVSILVAVPLG